MMEQLTDHQYEVLTVPEEAAANCVYIKGVNATNFLLHRHAEECPDSVSVSTESGLSCDGFHQLEPVKDCIKMVLCVLWCKNPTTKSLVYYMTFHFV